MPVEDPAVRIIRRLAQIQKARKLRRPNLEAVLKRQIARLYAELKL